MAVTTAIYEAFFADLAKNRSFPQELTQALAELYSSGELVSETKLRKVFEELGSGNG
jgi:hypothetical protein